MLVTVDDYPNGGWFVLLDSVVIAWRATKASAEKYAKEVQDGTIGPPSIDEGESPEDIGRRHIAGLSGAEFISAERVDDRTVAVKFKNDLVVVRHVVTA